MSRLENVYEDAIRKIDHLIERLRTPVMFLSDDAPVKGDLQTPFSSNFEKPAFLKSVDHCKEYIKAGDIFQVVISQRLKTQAGAEPFDIYRVLRVLNPSPTCFI